MDPQKKLVEQAETAVRQAFPELEKVSEEDRQRMVLFPATHNKTVEFLGEERTLRPLTAKWAKQLHAALLPFQKIVEAAQRGEDVVDIDDDLFNGLVKGGALVAEFYGWESAQKKIAEHDFLVSELQELLMTQAQLNGENDFLLSPLRSLLTVMQIAGVLQNQYQTQFGGQATHPFLAPPSTPSSPNTPQDNSSSSIEESPTTTPSSGP